MAFNQAEVDSSPTLVVSSSVVLGESWTAWICAIAECQQPLVPPLHYSDVPASLHSCANCLCAKVIAIHSFVKVDCSETDEESLMAAERDVRQRWPAYGKQPGSAAASFQSPPASMRR